MSWSRKSSLVVRQTRSKWDWLACPTSASPQPSTCSQICPCRRRTTPSARLTRQRLKSSCLIADSSACAKFTNQGPRSPRASLSSILLAWWLVLARVKASVMPSCHISRPSMVSIMSSELSPMRRSCITKVKSTRLETWRSSRMNFSRKTFST